MLPVQKEQRCDSQRVPPSPCLCRGDNQCFARALLFAQGTCFPDYSTRILPPSCLSCQMLLEAELTRGAEAQRGPSLLGQAPLAPPAGAADWPTCQGLLQLIRCSVLSTSFPPLLPGSAAPLLQRVNPTSSEDTEQARAACGGLQQESKNLPRGLLVVLMAQSAFSLPFFPLCE